MKKNLLNRFQHLNLNDFYKGLKWILNSTVSLRLTQNQQNLTHKNILCQKTNKIIFITNEIKLNFLWEFNARAHLGCVLKCWSYYPQVTYTHAHAHWETSLARGDNGHVDKKKYKEILKFIIIANFAHL